MTWLNAKASAARLTRTRHAARDSRLGGSSTSVLGGEPPRVSERRRYRRNRGWSWMRCRADRRTWLLMPRRSRNGSGDAVVPLTSVSRRWRSQRTRRARPPGIRTMQDAVESSARGNDQVVPRRWHIIGAGDSSVCLSSGAAGRAGRRHSKWTERLVFAGRPPLIGWPASASTLAAVGAAEAEAEPAGRWPFPRHPVDGRRRRCRRAGCR